jgi:hypothetical protein
LKLVRKTHCQMKGARAPDIITRLSFRPVSAAERVQLRVFLTTL